MQYAHVSSTVRHAAARLWRALRDGRLVDARARAAAADELEAARARPAEIKAADGQELDSVLDEATSEQARLQGLLEAERRLASLDAELDQWETRTLMAGEHDACGAALTTGVGTSGMMASQMPAITDCSLVIASAPPIEGPRA